MKNIIALHNKDDVYSFISGLWKTELFKNSKYIKSWTDKASQFPMSFAEMTNEELEYPHFGTWFGVTYLREYDNPIISDLYYLHEIVHSSLLTFDPEIIFTAWYRKMNQIEFLASLETEGYVYIEMPELRDVSFKDEIWADRFLGAKRLGSSIKDIMKQERYKAMHDPDPFDYCEQQIAAYARQNFEWANIWKLNVEAWSATFPSILPAYKHVEKSMYLLRNKDTNIDLHIDWIKYVMHNTEVPFPEQAKLFSDTYWRNKLGYRKAAK